MTRRFFEYRANLHVHSTFSDGSGTVDQIIAAARKTGLDLLLFNDHDTLAAKDAGYEGYHHNLLVLVGLEYSGPHNHYLVYGVDRYTGHDWNRPQTFIDDVRSQGGKGFIAHPYEKGSPFADNGHAFTWKDWNVQGFDGLCVWNYTSSWKKPVQSMAQGLLRYVFRKALLPGPEPETLSKWDQLSQTRPMAGIAGSDAHAWPFKAPGRTVTIFPYEYLFQAVNTHLLLKQPLTGDAEKDKESVIHALAGGACFMAHDKLRDSTGFEFGLEDKGGFLAGQGEAHAWQEGLSLAWRLPAPALVKVVRNGKVVHHSHAAEERFAVPAQGVYRLEAFWPLPLFGPRPWIFSNPIYVR